MMILMHIFKIFFKKNDIKNTLSPSKAYFSSNTQDSKGRLGSSELECSWCEKRGYIFKGHNYRNCRKLAAENFRKKGKDKAKYKQTANTVSTSMYQSNDEDSVSEKAFVVNN